MGYSPPVGDMAGVQTFVSPESHANLPSGWEGEKKQVLPPGSATPNTPNKEFTDKDHGRSLPHPEYQGPASGSGTVEKKPIKPEQGEEYGVPEKNDYYVPKRRSMTADGYQARRPWERQRRQHVDERFESKRYYKRNKKRILTKARVYYKKLKRNPIYKKLKGKRRDNPAKYKRRKLSMEIPFVTGPSLHEGVFLGVSPLGAHYRVGDTTEQYASVDVFLDSVVFHSDEDILRVAHILAPMPCEGQVRVAGLTLNDEWLLDEREEADKEGIGKYTPLSPGKRRRKQKGKKRVTRKRQYKKNRQKERVRAKLYYKKRKHSQRFKRQQTRRRSQPSRYKLRRGTQMTTPDIAFVWGAEMLLGYVQDISPESNSVTFSLENEKGEESVRTLPLEDFLDEITFLSEEDIEALFALVDEVLGLEGYDFDPGEIYETEQEIKALIERVASRYAGDIILYDQEAPTDQETIYGPELSSGKPERGKGDDTYYDVEGGGLSWRVVSPGDGSQLVRSAATMKDISTKTGPKVHERARGVQLQLNRADPKRGIWSFRAASSKGAPYIVRIKGIKERGITKLSTARVQVSCTCPFFQWQGPEHWAKKNGYLYGKTEGTASIPDVKDPKGQHWACKHVLAVLNQVRTYRMASAESLQALLQNATLEPVFEPSPERVASLHLKD